MSSHWSDLKQTVDSFYPSSVTRGRKLESLTIGKQPGRQIIIYDKRREAIAHQKHYWFKAWGLDPANATVEVWRIEVRAGKNELSKKYKIFTFADFEAGIGDIVSKALRDIRYLAEHQRDGNVSRQDIHPLWLAAQKAANQHLFDHSSGLTPDQIRRIHRDQAIEQYRALCVGNAIGLGISEGCSDENLQTDLPKLTASAISTALRSDEARIRKSLSRARARLHFVADS